MLRRNLKRRLIMAFALVAGVILLVLWKSNRLVENSSNGRVYATAEKVPARKVGLLLGCSRYLRDGQENLFFRYRIDRAVELYRAGKVQYLIVSGDNSRKDYDEPTAMREALIERGVPDELIYSDFAGFSTLDSVVRAKAIFGQNEIVVISQEFHVRRAIFIGQENGIDVIGACARDVSGRNGIKTHLREYLARVKTVLDVRLLDRSPTFLGEPVLVGKS